MQHPKNSNTASARKRWYERVIEATTLWKAIEFPISSPWKTKTTQVLNDHTTTTTSSTSRKLRKCSSTKTASSFSHVYCLCAPISSSYTDIFQTNVVVPRRSCSYGRSRSLSSSSSGSRSRSRSRRGGEKIFNMQSPSEVGVLNNNGRMSIEGRKIFRGKSLRDDVLMRRFVVEEEEMMMMMKVKVKVRRRNEMEVIRRRSGMRRNKIGPSPLSRMLLAI